MSPWLSRVALPLILMVVGLAAVGCGGGGGPPSPTVTAEPSPEGSATPAAGPTIQLTPQLPLGPAATPEASVDLADVSPLLAVLAADLADSQTGVSPLAVGDFNADGIGDILIGLPFADGPDNSREDAGEAFVVFGGRGLDGEIDLAEETPGLHILGALPGDNLGFGLAGGDLNGDGIDDVIVGAPASNGLTNIRTDLGEAYVIFGRSDLGGTIDTAEEEQDFTLIAAEGFARVGSSFAVADVNGDGISDLVAGAPFGGREPGSPVGSPRTTVGEVYVVFGSRDLRGRVSVAEDEQDLILTGVKELDAFGNSVAAGDVNGDGIADIVVGGRGFSGPDGDRESAGAVFVFFGSPDLSGRLGIGEADFTLLGADEKDGLGEVVAGGDFNGDGLVDVLAVARAGDGPDNRRDGAGEAYVVFGAGSLSGTLDLASQTADAVVYGVDPSSLLATAVAAGDLDGDNLDDVTLATPLAVGAGRSFNGVVYVLFGDGLAGATDLRQDVEGSLFIYGAADRDGLASGAAVVDFDGDGRPELALAAARSQAPDVRTPKIYLIVLP